MSKELKRMQELAGVSVNEEDTNDPVAIYLRGIQKDIMDLALVTDRFYKAWTDDPTPGSLTRFDKQEGGRIERQPSWKVAMERFSEKDMYNYLLFKVSEMSNGLDLDKGNLDKYLDGVLDEILRLTKGNFNREALIKEFPNSANYIGQLGSGNVQKDKDILARLLTVDNSFLTSGGYGAVGKLKSDKELYKDFKDGTLFSSSFGNLSTVSEEKNKTNKMSKELNRMQKLAGVPAKKETESLNEHQIGGIVGVGAINQIPPREKTDYEMAFEHFMTEGEEKEVEEASCGNYEEDDVKESYYEEDDPITGTDIDDIDMSPSVPDFGDDEIKGTELEEENKEAAEVSKLKSYLEGTGKAALQQINKKEELKSIFSAIFAGMSDTMKKNPSVAKIFDIANSKLK